jgi:hypothetical protein
MNKFNKVMVPVIITFSLGNLYLKREEIELHSEQMVYADNLGSKLSVTNVTGSTQTISISKNAHLSGNFVVVDIICKSSKIISTS